MRYFPNAAVASLAIGSGFLFPAFIESVTLTEVCFEFSSKPFQVDFVPTYVCVRGTIRLLSE